MDVRVCDRGGYDGRQKNKGEGKREPYYPMPEQIPYTPENIARAVTRTRPPKDGWAYEREFKAKRGDV